MNKQNTPNKTAIIASLAVVAFLVIGSAVTVGGAAKAETSFWDSIGTKIALFSTDRLFENAPDLSVEDIVVGGSVPFHVNHQLTVRGWLTYGGKVNATTTTGAATTLKTSDLLDYGYIDLMSNTEAHTFTLPATSTMLGLLPYDGATRKWLIHNATSTSGITLTFTAGTGMHLVGVAGAEVIDEEEWAELTCTNIYYRSADNEDILCIVTELEE